MEHKIITGKVLDNEHYYDKDAPAIKRVMEGTKLSLSEIEKMYKKRGGTMVHAVFGADPFDFWIGRFYLGTFGVLSLIGIFFGTLFYFYQAFIVERVPNILQARIDPPPISAGLRLMSPNEPGFFWQLIVFAATLAFLGWLLRQVDISRKLDMSYEIPIAYGAVVFSWLTLQFFRPIAMGAWGNGFALGITHHLDWVSNIGYQYFNFFYNPFHALGITLLFTSTLVLAMHGSIILSSANRPYLKEDNEDGFWRNLLGYSIGEIGIHRLAFWVGTASVLVSNVCIWLSGTLVYDWNAFWSWWDRFPIWETTGVMTALAIGTVIWRGRRGRAIDPREQEYGGYGLEGTAIKKPIDVPWLKRLFGNGQVGPIYLGVAGTIGTVFFLLAVFIILEDYLFQVGYNPILFVRDFFELGTMPPPAEAGLGFANQWHTDPTNIYNGGNAWVFSTFFVHISVIAFAVRIWFRAKAADLGPHLFWSFMAAIFLYLVIYLIRPILLGQWAQAPGQGFRAILQWTNNVSVQSGNFYYNPFHMLSIFFLLGSTLLLAMHGATIVAASRWGAHREVEEMMAEGSGTHRAQLFWRWCMGFQASSKTIHWWAIWFAALTGITGGIGLLLSGPVIQDWFAWAIEAGIVAPLP